MGSESVNNMATQTTKVDPELNDVLRFKTERVNIINVDPRSTMFVFWFIVSCYFPVLTACLGPIANAFSVACVVEKWRTKVDIVDGVTHDIKISDPRGVFAVNIISLVLGFVSNIILLLHFANKISYKKSQLLNVVGWTTAGIMLITDVIICGKNDLPQGYSKTIGFWFAAITSALYMGCTFTLSVHYVGYVYGKYPPKFNLIKNERAVMVFTVILSLWLIWGAGLFSSLLHISYCDALYFTVVSILTIGFGDILPNSVATKIMVLVYSLNGVILLCLIVAMTRSIIMNSLGPIFFFHRMEASRHRIYKIISRDNVKMTPKESFYLMKHIKRVSRRKQIAFSLASTIFIFIVFLLVGALVFSFAEDWSYFNSMYFCFLCLLTIGYGDYAPKTGAGRAFFVLWAIAAVPLMGAIISTVGDVFYRMATSLDLSIGRRFHLDVKAVILKNRSTFNLMKINSGEIILASEEEIEGESGEESDEIDVIPDEGDSEENEHVNVDSRNVSIDMNRIDFTPTRLNSVITPEYTHYMCGASSTSFKSETETYLEDEYSKLMKIQRLVQNLSHISELYASPKDEALSYTQWTDLFRECIHDQNNNMLEKPNFWISNETPLKYPLDEVKYAISKIFKKVRKITAEMLVSEKLVYERIHRKVEEQDMEYDIENTSSTISNSGNKSRRRSKSL